MEQLLEKEQIVHYSSCKNQVLQRGDDPIYTAQTYISDASISPSNLEDGQRILMWSGKYLNISTTSPETRAVAGCSFQQ